MFVIFAPHIDDELIGCYTYLMSGLVRTVYYFFDATAERIQEAYNLQHKLKSEYNIIYDIKFTAIPNIIELDKDDTILVPNINDEHPQHKLVNLYAKKNYKNKKLYYSIDMNVRKRVLLEYQRDTKKELLKSYPSQQKLLESDDKYFLFESVLTTDSTVEYTKRYIKGNTNILFKSNDIELIDKIINHMNYGNTNMLSFIYDNITDDSYYLEYTMTYPNGDSFTERLNF
jgi:hypothetical protein